MSDGLNDARVGFLFPRSSVGGTALKTAGPLSGVRIVEFAAIGPGPFAAMLLGDMGADVIRINRPGADVGDGTDVVDRSRRSVVLDLKDAAGRAGALDLLAQADALIEGFRPGVMERLGLGPDDVRKRSPRLVYGRMTGWGQTGPLAHAAGHDINYIALAGALAAIGPAGCRPVPPLNLVGDYGGGALYLVVGILAALLEARMSGMGQTVDCAMCDGVASLMSLFVSLQAKGRWTENRGANLLDGAAHFYTTYECADGRYVSIGALEPQFYTLLTGLLGVDDLEFADQNDQRRWPALHAKLQAVFRSRSRDDWCTLLEGTDACFAPVLTLAEAAQHPHLIARQTFVDIDGVVQPAPAPRFSRTPSAVQSRPGGSPLNLDDAIRHWRDGRVTKLAD